MDHMLRRSTNSEPPSTSSRGHGRRSFSVSASLRRVGTTICDCVGVKAHHTRICSWARFRFTTVHLIVMKVSLQRVAEASAITLNELGTPDPTFDMVQIGPGLVLTVEMEPDDDGERLHGWRIVCSP